MGETAGCNGNVEQAQGLLKLSDQLRDEREEIRKSLNLNSQGMPGSHALREEYAAQQKAMEVCDTCGAFLIVGDAQQRIDDHLLGKQHVGYARLRTAVDDVMEMRQKYRDARDKDLEERRSKDSEKKRSSRSRSRDRNHSRRDHRKRSRSRENRDRSHRRDRDRRDRDRDRDRRSRRSRERGSKRSRSRSRDRKRSRDRSKRDSSKSPSRTSKD